MNFIKDVHCYCIKRRFIGELLADLYIYPALITVEEVLSKIASTCIDLHVIELLSTFKN